MYKIIIKENLFNLLDEHVQKFLKRISSSEREISYFLNDRCSPKSDVDEDLCRMMTDIVKHKKLTEEKNDQVKSGFNEEKKAYVKSYVGITYKKVVNEIIIEEGIKLIKTIYQKQDCLNCPGDLEKLANITELPVEELEFQIEEAINEIKEYNQNIANEINLKIKKFDYLKKECELLEKRLNIVEDDDEFIIIKNELIDLKNIYDSKIWRIKSEISEIVYGPPISKEEERKAHLLSLCD